MSRLALSFLGPSLVLLDGKPVELKRRKPLALLAYLAVTAQTRSRDALTELLYPGHPREQGYSNFRQTLAALRQAIGETWLIADQGGLRLKNGKDLWVDVAEFRRLVESEKSRGKVSGSAGSAKSLSRAAALVRGTFLAGFSLKDSAEFEDWQNAEADGLGRDHASVLERLVDLHESREEYREAIEPCRTWLSLDGFAEATHCRLMRLYALSGQRSLALKQYERCKTILEKELGEKPGRETEDLREQIARGGLQPPRAQKADSRPAASPAPSEVYSIPFVGRESELGRLKSAAEQARGGKGRMVMLVGEAGIGKTRLLEEAAAHSRAGGARVTWGRCYPDAGLPPLWPWRQALGQLVRESKPDSLRKWAGTRAAVLGEVIEELGEKLGTMAPPVRLEDPESERFRLADAVAHFLDAAAAEQPLTVVLDDLHCADSASLGLLEFVSRGLGDSRVLLLAASRSVESEPGHALGRTLGELARERCFERMELSALRKEQVAEMAGRSAGPLLPPGFADALWERTRGNALFVVESLRFRQAETPAGAFPVPPSIRALIRRQLQDVSPDCYALLETAAALGAEFTLELLGAATGLSGSKLLETVDEAVRARFLVEEAGSSGPLRFGHPLIQETISGELSRSRRTELHAGIAKSLERFYGEETEAHAIELARHYAEGQPLAPAERLARFSLLAGEQELKNRAYGEALPFFQRGLAAKGPGTNDAETAWLRFGLAQALPKDYFNYYSETEYSGGDPSAFAELSSAYEYFVKAGDVDAAVEVAAHPLVLLNRRSGERRVLATRGLEIVRSGSIDEARLLRVNAMVDYDRNRDYPVLSQRMGQALAIAQRHGDGRLEFRVQSSWAACAGEHTFAAAAEKVERALELIGEVDDPVAEFRVHNYAFHIAMSGGNLGTAARHTEALLATADRLRTDYHMKIARLFQIELCWVRGDWAAMWAASDQALSMESDSMLSRQHLGWRARLELELGNEENGRRYLSRYLAGLKAKGFGRDAETGIAVLDLASIARLTPGRELLELVRTAAAFFIPPGQGNLTEGAGYGFAWAGLALAAPLLGDRELAGRLRRYFAEHDEAWTPGLHASTMRRRGLLDLALGDADAAVGELEQTLIDYAAQRPGPNVAWICSELAEALLARAMPGDAQRAADLLKEGLAMATTLGMVPLQERFHQLASRVPVPARRMKGRGQR